MKHYLIILLSIYTTFSYSFAQNLPFKTVRMITDFRGVAYNNDEIICYGDYGIITYSNDFGNNWQQINLGDKYSILKIIPNDNEFYGATGFSLVKFSKNATQLVNKEIYSTPEIWSFALNKDGLIILTNNKLLFYDFNLNPVPNHSILLDTSIKGTEIIADNLNAYILTEDNFLFRINLITEVITKIEIISGNYCNNCFNLSHLKIIDSTIYLMLESNISQFENYANYQLFNTIIKSEDKCDTWIKLSDSIKYSVAYDIYNKVPYFISEKSDCDYLLPCFSGISTNGNINIINNNDTIERDILYDYTIEGMPFNDMIRINNDTLIAVGKNKLITVSYDNGKSWSIKSYFNCYWRSSDPNSSAYYVNEKIIFMPYKFKRTVGQSGYGIMGNGFYHTTDGGVTWLPQHYDSLIQKYYRAIENYLFKEDGSGICLLYNIYNDTKIYSILKTQNYGDNFKIEMDTIHKYPITSISTTGLNLIDKSLFGFTNIENNNIYSVLYFLDNNNNLTDSIKLDSIAAQNIVQSDDGTLFLFGTLKKGYYKDSTKYGPQYKNQILVLLKSTDKGKQWETLVNSVPMPKNNNSSICYYFNNIIYFPLRGNIDTGDVYFYKYNILENSFDSIKFTAYFQPNDVKLFDVNNKIYTVSADNKLYYNLNSGSKLFFQDSINASALFYSWDNYSWNYHDNYADSGKDNLLVTFGNADNRFLIIGKNDFSSYGSSVYKINVVKAIHDTTITDITDYKTEKEKTYLYGDIPYPIPAHNIVYCQLFWSQIFNIDDAVFNVYDILGTKLNNQGLNFTKTSPFSGIIRWDCNKRCPGIYYIYVSLNGDNISIPVVID